MDWTNSIARLIELNTFSSIWYWLAVIVSWAAASNWLIGVPFDMLFRARKCAPQEIADLEALVDIQVRRIVWTNDLFGTGITALLAFVLVVLGMLGFVYGMELAQGVIILAAPLTLIVVINMRVALQLHAAPLAGRDLVRYLFKVRLWTQLIAMVAMFLTAMYGTYFNLQAQLFF